MVVERQAGREKTRDEQTRHLDSNRWNAFAYRDGDVVVATWGKSGTTWTEQLVSQLIHGAPNEFRKGIGPWFDLRALPEDEVRAQVEAMDFRRCIKTHLAADALYLDPRARYIYVGRDLRDIIWSAHNHQASFTQEALDRFNALPDWDGEPLLHPIEDIREYYRQSIKTGFVPNFGHGDLWENFRSWWEVRHLPNVLLLHFDKMKTDFLGQAKRVAAFLEIEVPDQRWPVIEEHCSIDCMRKLASDSPSMTLWTDGANSFFNKGTNGRWRDVLSPEEAALVDEVGAKRLSPDCLHWMKSGEFS